MFSYSLFPYIPDTDLELEPELVLLVDETPSTPVNSKLVAKINTLLSSENVDMVKINRQLDLEPRFNFSG